MKSLLAITLVTFSFTSQASWRLESHYGKMFVKDGKFFCSLTNTTGKELNIKYVQFTFVKVVGNDTSVVIQNRIDKTLPSGETLVEPSGQNRSVIERDCKFMVR